MRGSVVKKNDRWSVVIEDRDPAPVPIAPTMSIVDTDPNPMLGTAPTS